MLETERLLLRPFEKDDSETLHRVLGDAEAMRYYPHPFSPAEVDDWSEANRVRYERDGFGLWAMVLKVGGELVGDCGLTVQTVDGEDLVEIGWHVRRDLQRLGLATEAGLACREHGFEELGRAQLISLVRPENVASCRVAKKVGMTVWKETRRGGPNDDWLHRVYRIRRP